MYMTGLRSSRGNGLRLLGGALLVTAAGIAAMAAGPVSDHGSMAVASLFVSITTIITAGWATGYAVRQQRAYTAGLREQAEQRARDQVTQARGPAARNGCRSRGRCMMWWRTRCR
jgi:hypothetical protein